MSYGHVDKIPGRTIHTPAVGNTPPTDPALYRREDVRPVLATRDIGALYRLLSTCDVSQRTIAALTGQSQSEVSEILKGRRVVAYDVLERIAAGLGIPRELMGLSYGENSAGSDDGAYAGAEGGFGPEVEEEMRRRALIAATSLAALGRVLQGLGELTELALPAGESLPSRLGMGHVHAVEAVTERLRTVARQYGGQAGVFGAAAKHYTRWMGVPATAAVKARLGCALAELHTEAGWACYDSGVDGKGYFTRALGLADEVGDGFGIANAAWHAGATLVRSGHPDDALKAFQLGQFSLAGFQPGKSTPATLRADDPRLPTLTARLKRNSATAYALLGYSDQAKSHLAKAHDGWAARDGFDRAGMELATAGVHLDLHRLDTAHQFAAGAARTYGGTYGRGRTNAELLLAEVHVRAGEPRGLVLARQAIAAVSALQSVAMRRERLQPLAEALEARSGSDARELARMARQVATT
ncbi:MAG: helix-turn-helix domain-containing protein [Actinomycetota bacterium]|nr:helix-turn-helix domain-containing protein [Actinomycetota bacterium]